MAADQVVDEEAPRCRYCGEPIPPPSPEQEKAQANQKLTPRRFCSRSHRKAHAEQARKKRQDARDRARGRIPDPVEGCITPDKKVWSDPIAAQRIADGNGMFVYRCKTGVELHYHLTSGRWGEYRRYDKPEDVVDDKIRWAQSQAAKADA